MKETLRIMLMFEHPACNNVVVDIHLSLPEQRASPIDATAATLAARVRPACPICKDPMHYRAWGFSDTNQQDEVESEHTAMLQSPQSPLHQKADHRPLLTRDRGVLWMRIVGCTCGWRPPPGHTDSEEAFSTHAASTCAAEGVLR